MTDSIIGGDEKREIIVADYDPTWPEKFEGQRARIRGALDDKALRIEHVGSTSVPGLPAKPIVDICLVVEDSAAEDSYLPELEAAGYILRVREPEWHEHRMFRPREKDVHLHVFSQGSSEVERMLLFREWLRSSKADRELYAETKRELAKRDWERMQDYADAKTDVVSQIMNRAQAAASLKMSMNDVVELYAILETNGVMVWVDGGWGVDALLGRQTRRHRDLDITFQRKDESKLRELLTERGYREKGEDYATPYNYILTDDDGGHEIDLHIIELDEHGNGVYGDDSGESFTARALGGRGTIGGREVRCIAAEDAVRFHSGYELREKDFKDVSALCEAFGIALPAEYERFLP